MLLLPAVNERASIYVLAILRAVAAFITLIVVAVDAGIYDSVYNITTPKVPYVTTYANAPGSLRHDVR
jgi:hypothetical protein